MGAKIIGFTDRVDGYRTRQGRMNTTIFINACKKLAEETNTPWQEYHTKRQAGKFFKGEGVVFNHVNGENNGV